MNSLLSELCLKEKQVFAIANEEGSTPYMFMFSNGSLEQRVGLTEDFEPAPNWLVVMLHDNPELIVTNPVITKEMREFLLFIRKHFMAKWIAMDSVGRLRSYDKKPTKGIGVWMPAEGSVMTPDLCKTALEPLVSWEDDEPVNIEELLYCNGGGQK